MKTFQITINVGEHSTFEDISAVLRLLAYALNSDSTRTHRPQAPDAESIEGLAGGTVGYWKVVEE